ncbi:MAG TPA: hypothetical protein VFA75_00425 [Nevskia sp.]|nr:hypothetical protein [Nevskia sp.]
MSEVHYFPRYKGRENFASNNTLLFLLRVYQDNQRKLENLLSSLGDGLTLPARIGLRFHNQVGTGGSVLDMALVQDGLNLGVETKRGRTFGMDQLLRHLDAFRQGTSNVLLLLCPDNDPLPEAEMVELRAAAAKRNNVTVIATTFEDLIANARLLYAAHDEEMLAVIDDYAAYCAEEELLSIEKFLMFVPPCGQSYDTNLACSLYFCPTSYSRRRVGYLGVYSERTITHIGQIRKVVCPNFGIDSGTGLEATQPRLTDDERRRILTAAQQAEGLGWSITQEHQFFLCDRLVETDFRKDTPRGIQGHRYLDLREYVPTPLGSVDEVATMLRAKTWG